MNLKCSVCKSEDVRQTHGRGFLGEKVLALIRMWPYRCGSCRNRFYRFRLQNRVEGPRVVERRQKKNQEEQFSQFFQSSDEKEFKELIARIREDEKKTFGLATKPKERQ